RAGGFRPDGFRRQPPPAPRLSRHQDPALGRNPDPTASKIPGHSLELNREPQRWPKTSQEFGCQAAAGGLTGVFPVSPGGCLVVAGAGLEAAVQDADKAAGQSSQGIASAAGLAAVAAVASASTPMPWSERTARRSGRANRPRLGTAGHRYQ